MLSCDGAVKKTKEYIEYTQIHKLTKLRKKELGVRKDTKLCLKFSKQILENI